VLADAPLPFIVASGIAMFAHRLAMIPCRFDGVQGFDGFGADGHYGGSGLIKNKCDEGDRCPNWRQTGVPIEAIWCPNGEGNNGPSWAYKTEIPHAEFKIMEEGDVYCIGIVFRLDQILPTARLIEERQSNT
jgi:hypothetical protein